MPPAYGQPESSDGIAEKVPDKIEWGKCAKPGPLCDTPSRICVAKSPGPASPVLLPHSSGSSGITLNSTILASSLRAWLRFSQPPLSIRQSSLPTGNLPFRSARRSSREKIGDFVCLTSLRNRQSELLTGRRHFVRCNRRFQYAGDASCPTISISAPFGGSSNPTIDTSGFPSTFRLSRTLLQQVTHRFEQVRGPSSLRTCCPGFSEKTGHVRRR